MKIIRSRKSLIFFINYCTFWIIISIALSWAVRRGEDLTRFIPITNMGIEATIIAIILLPLSSTLGLFIGGYVFSPLFLYFHKKIFNSKVEYGIYDKPESRKL